MSKCYQTEAKIHSFTLIDYDWGFKFLSFPLIILPLLMLFLLSLFYSMFFLYKDKNLIFSNEIWTSQLSFNRMVKDGMFIMKINILIK